MFLRAREQAALAGFVSAVRAQLGDRVRELALFGSRAARSRTSRATP